MDDPAGSDNGLLDRLNALKPTTVNLDAPSKSVPVSTIDSAKPASREDALSERLKSLRNQPDTKLSKATDAELDHDDRASPISSSGAQLQAGRIPAGTDIGISRQATTPIASAAGPGTNDVDPLLDTDDQTLEELLADLGSDEQWLEEVAAEVAETKDEEHRRVTALLEELAKAPPLPEPSSDIATSSSYRDTDEKEKSDGDDSDAEPMTREIDDVLAQAMDEVNLERASQSPHEEELVALRPTGDVTSDTFKPRNKASGAAPRTAKDLESDPFRLPSVPSELQDQPDESLQDTDFEAEIASRMAALRGSGGPGLLLPSAPTSKVDELSLPGVPTFAPADRPVKGVYKRYGYTDEDAKTWCTVCLEDGTVRCFGCDDDIYCARCWKEMHVGPSAGYDERGHRWEKFAKNR